MGLSSSHSAVLVAIDWGTTNRRGYLLDTNGGTLDTCEDELGLVNIMNKEFYEAFKLLATPWMEEHGPMPAVLSGMVGASTGWVEAKYCSLPAGLDDLAQNLQPVPMGSPIWIVPGVRTRDDIHTPDVIRGEEIQAIAASTSNENLLIVAPGTHSKWIQIKDGRIVWFTTFMTGDVHAAVLNHTVISQLHIFNSVVSPKVFALGVKTGYSQNANLTHVIFGARTRVLFKDLEPKDVSGYLSGLLIGAEISGALSALGTSFPKISLIGSEHLCALYRKAFELCGADCNPVTESAIGKTYIDIAKRAGLLECRYECL